MYKLKCMNELNIVLGVLLEKNCKFIKFHNCT